MCKPRRFDRHDAACRYAHEGFVDRNVVSTQEKWVGPTHGEVTIDALSVHTTMDEGTLEPMLDRVVRGHADVEIGSYPRWGGTDYRTKLTFDGVEAERVQAARDAFATSLPAETIVVIEQ